MLIFQTAFNLQLLETVTVTMKQTICNVHLMVGTAVHLASILSIVQSANVSQRVKL